MAIRADRVGVREDQVDIHGRVTSPSFLNELLEDLPEWTDMPVWVNGTEELLPSNNSVPVTSPILTDIAYPDIRRDNQYFTYRESPTPVDGLAKIKSIKGNTLVWNQLVQNGNFATNADWITPFPQNGTLSIANNEATLTLTVNPSSNADLALRQNGITYTQGHKYLLSAEFYLPKAIDVRYEIGGGGWGANVNVSQTNTWVRAPLIITRELAPTATVLTIYPNIYRGGYVSGDSYKIRNVMVIDLTQMGLDISSPSEFTSLFSLPYYDFNQGSLLSFMGNGIKTVGKNLFDFSQFANGTITFENGVLTGTAGQFYSAVGIDLVYPKNTQITISFDARTEQNQASTGGGVYLMSNENGTPVQLATTANSTTAIQHITVTIPSNRHIDKLGWSYGSNSGNIWHITNFQVEFGATETSYDPYTESTLSLPISTYFPTGMKSAGTVYDELTPRKAITRIGAVDMGTLTWSKEQNHFYSDVISNCTKPSAGNVPNIICSKYLTYAYATVISETKDDAIGLSTTPRIYVYDTSYTDATAFKTAMSGVYLYYELATPVELPTMSFE